ncbi:MAG: hypothetical protein ISP90_18120 [Nevskia sp.]|nr:hypothetical protein [Nevskia sp.]
MNNYLSGLALVITSITVVPLVFSIFKTNYRFSDVALMAVIAGAVLLVPTIGAAASFAAMVAVLYWRTGGEVSTDIFVATAAARLAAIPVLFVLHLNN